MMGEKSENSTVILSIKSLLLTDEQRQDKAQHMQIRSSKKKKEYKITRAYRQKISLKSPLYFEKCARLTSVL